MVSHRGRVAVWVIALSCHALGCMPPPPPGVPPDAGRRHDAGRDAGRTVMPIDPRTVTGQIGPLHIAAGNEQTLCSVFDLGNEEPVMLRGIRTHLGPGSHHLIVQTANDERGPRGPSPCTPFSHGGEATVFIAQSAEAGLAYPSDAGLQLRAHQLIGLEMHVINYISPDPVDITGSVELDVSAVDPSLRTVFVLFTGPLGFVLPPHQSTHLTYEHPFSVGTNLLAVATHTHALGTYSSLRVVSSPEDSGTLIHESYSWSDGPLTVLDPPRGFPEGGWLRLECDFDNDRDESVYFGESFNDEMCFLWAYYLSPLPRGR